MRGPSPLPGMSLPPLLALLRPHQWVKNVFVGAPFLFALTERSRATWGDSAELLRVALAVASFSLAASSIYVVNDVLDRESDRRHPEKRKRPIASGAVSVPAALAVGVACLLASIGLATQAESGAGSVLGVVLAYVVMNSAYSLRLKHVVLVDVFCIALGFLLRVLAGGFAVGVPLSNWLKLCTFFLALFLALCKRHAELELLGEDSGRHRKNLREYSIGFLDQATGVLAACSVLSYAMYTVDASTQARMGDGIVYTVPFVVFGIFRYLLLVQTRGGGGSPSRVLLGGDVTFVLNALAWLATVVWVLAGHSPS